jgi:predicted RNase H-like nuclease (RuvC/YqgF family)
MTGKGMEVIIVGVVGAISAIIVQGIGFFLNRKSGLSEAQEAYQGTLEGMNKALGSRVTELEKTVTSLTEKNERLEERVEDLTRQVRDLTVENLDLLRRLVAAGIQK